MIRFVRWRVLRDVPDEEVRRLLSVARRRRFSRNEVVFHRDDPGDSLHLVVSGRFSMQIMTPLGETATIAIRGPGDRFGEMALVTEGRKRSATVEALEEVTWSGVSVDEFDFDGDRSALVALRPCGAGAVSAVEQQRYGCAVAKVAPPALAGGRPDGDGDGVPVLCVLDGERVRAAAPSPGDGDQRDAAAEQPVGR
jgi:hypothetical protein